jgi:hypothetical protein
VQAAAEAGRHLHVHRAGPWYQNLILPLATPLLGGKKVVFA